MTKERRHGNDSCFGDWLRSQPDIRSSIPHCITANDVDYILHRYATNSDGIGERNVHLLMHVEVKVLGGEPSGNQLQTLHFWHQLTRDKRQRLVDLKAQRKTSVWSFGVFVCSCPGFYPGDKTEAVNWCVFDEDGQLNKQEITVEQLKMLLRFELHPETLQKLDLRRHHKTKVLVTTEQTPLGYTVEKIITARS